MRRLNLLLSLIAVIILVIGCFLPWMTIESKGITITGLRTEGTTFGKPAYFHFLWGVLFLVFLFINKVWSKRSAIGIAAFNIAWALRNFLLLPACQMGDCPVRKEGLYLILIAAIAMFVTPLIGDRTTEVQKS
jgi:hypothetical protein